MKRALVLLAAAAAIMATEGKLLASAWHLTYGHGLYCVIGVASTVGCDAGPHSVAGRGAAVVVILTCIPLLAAVFSWLTGRHAGRHAAAKVKEHLADAEKRIAEEADRRHMIMARHVENVVKAHCSDVKQHVSTVAQAAADPPEADPPDGAGESVVPPAATVTTTGPPPPTSRKRPKGM
jgi:hypothetical protein